MDLSGDGDLDLVTLEAPLPGFYERGGRDWRGFRTIPALPRIDWADPALRFVDLTGDGLADLLVTRDDGFDIWPSRGEEGFAPARVVRHSGKDRPEVAFTKDANELYLADMTGDGLTDLVRIRNGEVSYWPSLGHGRFGPRVTCARFRRSASLTM
ncbi:FG-GAP repeat domain-containing protein [Paracoccus xiamenensis]|uniref:FG-GAP repeat domain-containing protein n=1 Tax=Paracoccus xiamenensis TaxID=2714901 RepID=UPI00140C4A93|nr:VCBS repeat-containing protein [Paracoccus xiamenensis]NHF73486.1 VCBS repeat-containing protein [Paracoccus xiamenensis]